MADAPAPPETLQPVPPLGRGLAPNTRAALLTLAAAATAGVLGDALFRGPLLGLNLFLWVASLGALAGIVGARTGRHAPAGRWLLVAAGFASCFAIRSADFLLALNFAAILLALALPGLALTADLARTRLRDYAIALASAAGLALAGFPLFIGKDIAFDELKGKGTRRTVQALLGLALAAPLVAVFGSLFASADPAFAALARTLFGWNVAETVQHALIAALLAWLAAGLLRNWLWPPRLAAVRATIDATMPKAAALPVGMAVVAMVLTFAVFVAIQARWLFGGAALVERVTGLGYAEYARTGFFQMVAASGLAIPVLYGAEVLLDGAEARARARVRHLGRIQLLLVGVVMASALHRMTLYTSVYGLTQDRIVALAIIAWLAAVSGWFAVTVLRGRHERFTFGAVTSGFAVLAALNAVNPEALIARVNSARVAEGRQLDDAYLARLGPDAAPVLAERLRMLPQPARCVVAVSVRRFASEEVTWRGWSLSRSRARAVARTIDLEALGCPTAPPAAAPPSSGSR